MTDEPTTPKQPPTWEAATAVAKALGHHSRAPSLADVLAYEALPADVRALAERVLLNGLTPEGAGGWELYKEAFEDGVETTIDTIERTTPERADYEHALRRITSRAKGEK